MKCNYFVDCTKTALIKSIFFSPKCTKNHLVAGLCLDPLGELKHFPRLLSHGRGRGKEGKGKERRRREGSPGDR